MPKPAHLQVTFTGYFGNPGAPIDDWSFGFAGQSAGWAGAPTEGPNQAQDVWAEFVAANLVSEFAGNIWFDNVRVANVGADGLVVKTGVGQYDQVDFNPATIGSSGAGFPYPPQVALAVSLDSERSGPTGKGRFYLPGPAAAIGSDGRLATSVTDRIAGKVANFLSGVENNVSIVPVIASTKGYTSQVVRCRVGRVLDTQRRRRSAGDEGYSVSAVF